MNTSQSSLPLLQLTSTSALTTQEGQDPSPTLTPDLLPTIQSSPIFPFFNLFAYSNKTIPFTPLSANTPFSDQSASCFSVCHSGIKRREETNKRVKALRMMLKSPKSITVEPALKKKTKCNCRKSGCLKMYCDCFRERGYCEDCSCIGCMNNLEHEATRSETMKTIKARNPLAFEGLVVRSKQSGSSTLKHIKGCRCKKSNCRKKYCECFQLGIGCGADCTCTNCQNDGKKSMSEELEPEEKHSDSLFKLNI